MTNLIGKKQTDGLLDVVSHDASLTGSGTPSDPLSVVGGGGGGLVNSVVAGTGISVDDSDVQNPIVSTTITQYDNEMAQDAVGSILVDSSSIDFTYSDATPSITAVVAAGGVTNAMLAGSIAASKLVGTDITTVGTVTSGTWRGNTVDVSWGGTGGTSFTSRAIITGGGTGAMSALTMGTSNQLLGMNNAANDHEYKTISTGTTAQSNDIGVSFAANSVVIQIPDASATDRGVIKSSGSQTLAPTITFTNIPLTGADPTTSNQLTRKAYVDALFSGLTSPAKVSCAVATTANITLSGEQTIDGVSTSATRILVKNQSTTSQNGIYVTAAGAWSRATDYDTAAEVSQGTYTFVTGGNTQSGTLWIMNSPSVTTLGTDPVTFAQIGTANAYNFAVSQTDNGSNDFSVTVSGLNITYNLPTAGHGVRGALDGADYDTFAAKYGPSGSPTVANVPLFASATTLSDSGWALSISGGSSSTMAIPTSGTAATLAGSETLTNKTLTAPILSATASGTGAGRIGYTAGVLSFGDGSVQRTVATTDNTQTLTNKTISGASNTITNVSLTTGVTGVLPAANGGFVATDAQIFASSGTWNKPSGAVSVQVIAIGGGGGGGSGRKGASGTVRCGGGGGMGGSWASNTYLASILASSVTVTVGSGGAGGTAVSTASTNGNAGLDGGRTTFGQWLAAGAGSAGSGGTNSSGAGGTSTSGGFPSVSLQTLGGFGQSASTTGGAGNAAAVSYFSPAGGGSGAGITSGNVASAGGNGGTVGSVSINFGGYATQITGGTGGAANTAGNPGNASPTNSAVGGSGGGGGGSSTTTNAGSGGNGATYGAGGGGGGAATNSVGDSGAGGNGASGICIVITHF